MKIKFNTPIRVGDIQNNIIVDELQMVAFSCNYQPETYGNGYGYAVGTPITVSLTLQHLPNSWTHNIILRDDRPHPSGVYRDGKMPNSGPPSTAGTAKWQAILSRLVDFEKIILEEFANELPPGDIS